MPRDKGVGIVIHTIGMTMTNVEISQRLVLAFIKNIAMFTMILDNLFGRIILS